VWDHPSVSPAVSIRSAAATDVPAVRDVYRRSSMSNEGDRALFTLHPELLDWSDRAVWEGRTRVAIAGGRVVGFATLLLTETSADVEDLFVDPECVRRGIGRALAEDIAAVAHALGWPFIEVDANPHASSFYTRVGFVALGEAVVQYGSGVRMRRSTSP